MHYQEEVKEDGTIVNGTHPITYQSGTFQGSQKKWSVLAKDTYAIYMSFHKIVFYLKDPHVKIGCDHVSLCKFMYLVTKNDKVNNWSHKIHASTALNTSKEKTMSQQIAFQD